MNTEIPAISPDKKALSFLSGELASPGDYNDSPEGRTSMITAKLSQGIRRMSTTLRDTPNLSRKEKIEVFEIKLNEIDAIIPEVE